MKFQKFFPNRAGMNAGQRHRQTGFTFMELMLTIVILAILATIAVPNFQSALQNNRLTGQANEIVAALQFARSEALKRGLPVEMCASSDGATCGGNWNQGWMVFADLPGDPIEVLRVWPNSVSQGFEFTPATGRVRYQPNGFGDPALTPFTLDLNLPGCAGDNARQITVVATGRAASERVTCS